MTAHCTGRPLWQLCLSLWLTLASPAGQVAGASEAQRVALPAQTLAAALHHIAATHRLQLYYTRAMVADRRIPATEGTFTLRELLDRLLAEHELGYRFVNQNTLVLKHGRHRAQRRPAPPPRRQSPEPEATPPVVHALPRLEEVLVSSRRKPEDLQQTPLSISVITERQLAELAYQDLGDVGLLTPNLTTTPGQTGGSASLQLFIRGIGELDYMLSTDPAVGLYIDEVYVARSSSANLSTLDIQRIEVLRGPQGTLFGKNTIGGAVNITSREPEGSAGLTTEVTTRGLHASRFYSRADSATLGGGWAFSAALEYRDVAGWQQRPRGRRGGERQQQGLRLGASWEPTEHYRSNFRVNYHQHHQTPYANVLLHFDPDAEVSRAWREAGLSGLCCRPNSADRSGASHPLARDDLHSLDLVWRQQVDFAGGWRGVSISGYRRSLARFGQDYDHSQARYYAFGDRVDHQQFSQEVQLHSPDRRWLLGLYLFRERGDNDSELEVAPPLFEAGLLDLDLDLNLRSNTWQEVSSYALYVHREQPLSEGLTLSLGLRYTRERKTFNKRAINTLSGRPLFPAFTATPDPACSATGPASEGSPYSCEASWREFSPRLSLDFQLDDDTLLYLSASRGFRSGGFNGRPTELPLIGTYQPEHLHVLEAGFKTDPLPGRLRLNASAYYNDYRNKQQTLNTSDGSGAVQLLVTNAGEAHTQGFEAEFEAMAPGGWRLQLGLGYIHARFDEWRDALEGDLSHRRFPHTPRWTGHLALHHEQRLGQLGRLESGLNLHYRSAIYLDGRNSERLRASDNTVIDAQLRFTPAGERWSLALIGHNLGNRQSLQSGYVEEKFSGITHANYTAPRRLWLQWRYYLH